MKVVESKKRLLHDHSGKEEKKKRKEEKKRKEKKKISQTMSNKMKKIKKEKEGPT